MTTGMAGFRQRTVQPGDPVVCPACGQTVGAHGGLRTEEAILAARQAHTPDCRRRQTHQRRHRGLAGPCPDCAR